MIILNKYEIINKLGKGSFGEIYKGINIRTKTTVAIKVEKIHEFSLLKNETKIYQYLNGIKGIPNILLFGKDEICYYMVVDLLGDSLQYIRDSNGPFSLPSTLTIARKIIGILREVHNKFIIHRDVKPANFLLSIDKTEIYLIDFGFCKKYVLYDSKTHIPFREGKGVMGSKNYMSINIHNGYEPSRRDDLESIGYMMLYFLGITYDATIESKLWLTHTNNPYHLPKQVHNYFQCCRKLAFDEQPDYDTLVNNIT